MILANLSSVHMKKLCKQTPNRSPIFAIFVEYSFEKNMVEVIFGSTVGSHLIYKEVRRNSCLLLFF